MTPPAARVALRSWLYVPASADNFVAKAHTRGADAIILDLEDAVAPAEKLAARGRLAEAVPAVGQAGARVFVRINSEPELLLEDAQAACRAGATGLFVPKSRDPAALAVLAAHLDTVVRDCGAPRPLDFVPMLEDPGAVLDARQIGAASPRVMALIGGGEDLATALGGEPTPEVLRLPKLLVHLAAKALGVLSLGLLRSVADFRDIDGITRAAKEARDFGFDGATCIHPGVVPILNAAFAPSAAEAERARRMIAASQAAAAEGKGAFLFDGQMVDAPVVARAHALLAKLGAP